MRAKRSGLLFVAILSIAASALGCAGQSENALAEDGGASTGSCSVRLIVGLDRAPDAGLISDLDRASGSHLEVVSIISPDRLYVLSLSAEGPASNCDAAMERLRADPRVRSVEVDTRRQHNAP